MKTQEIIQETQEITYAMECIKKGKNVFIHGKPGTGKSTFIKKIVQHFASEYQNLIKLAPTGIAALNISGQTLHSFFRINPNDIYAMPDDEKTLRILGQKWRSVRAFIIDEISMVRADSFDVIDTKLRKVLNSNLPFAGKQLILVGDLHQLDPVLNKESDLEQDKLCAEYYSTPYVFSADCFNKLNLTHVVFKKIFRQKDATFIKHLSALLKDDDGELNNALAYFNQRTVSTRPQNAIALCAKRADAQAINDEELEKLPLPEEEVCSSHSNLKESDWVEKNCPAPYCLKLKKGARVMFLVNNNPEYVNGTIGTLVDFVKNKDDGQIETLEIVTNEGKRISLERHEWYKTKTDKNGRQVEDKERFFRQFPIRLAWATTIHKSQGMTFDEAYVNLGQGGAFTSGQTYVALSRVRSVQGLYLSKNIYAGDILRDLNVDQFYKKLSTLEESQE